LLKIADWLVLTLNFIQALIKEEREAKKLLRKEKEKKAAADS
jgi:hypothetical protein